MFASPTYKASYTDLLKTFLDRYPANGLRSVMPLSAMAGADFSHSMAPTVNLNALLFELGATVPVRGIYFNIAQIDQLVTAAVSDIQNALKSSKPIIDVIATSDSGGEK